MQKSKTNVVTSAAVSGIGREAAEHHGPSLTVQTEADLHLPTPYTITDQEEQSQTEQLTHDENPTEYIYQVSNNNYECQLETELTKAVKRNLKRHMNFWQNIGASPFTISIIQYGYKIPFITAPSKIVQRNNRSALQHDQFVEQAILELVQSGRIVRTDEIPHVVNHCLSLSNLAESYASYWI